jgi:hypothetical protein
MAFIDNHDGHDAAPYWLTEHPQPNLERNWSQLCRRYSTEASDRQRLADAIDNVRWHRLTDSVAFSPGLILQQLIPEARSVGLAPMAMGIGADPLDYPEPHLLGRPRKEVHPGYFETGYLIALRQLAARTTFSAYFLVLGDKTGQVVFDIDDRPLPEGRLTRACAARLHDLCSGSIDKMPCECPCGKARADTGERKE